SKTFRMPQGNPTADNLFAQQTITRRMGKFTLHNRPYTLALRHVFTIATSSRSTTPVVLVRLDFEGLSGYGEASMPPYLGESHESVMAFLSKVDLRGFDDPFQTAAILAHIHGLSERDTAAKAALDIALHDLLGKLMGQPWHRIWGYEPGKAPHT